MGRIASVVLVSAAGELLGMLPPLALPGPYWPESADLVAEVQARYALRIVVLRLLRADGLHQPGGDIAYLAELGSGTVGAELLPIPEPLRGRASRRDPKRMPWAELGGPTHSLRWARSVLAESGQSSFTAVQQRTWNLSAIWRLERANASPIWLKQVPHFMSHEGRLLRWLNRAAPGAAPTLLAADESGRSLLAHVPGEDLYGAPLAMRRLILDQLHVVQSVGVEAVDELLELGAPDLRGDRRAADIRRKLLAWSPNHPGLDGSLNSLEPLLARLEECGLPATLVHADNHPGNARGSADGVKLLDWGEAFIGNPVTDLMGLIGGLSQTEAAPLVARWCESWKSLAPRSKPEQALELAPLVGALHGAATYAHFLSQIEETEWPYHREDVPRCLQAADDLRGAALL